MNEMDEHDDSFPAPHPAFAAHFTDPIYEDPASDLAPFGSDEGFDLLYTWAERPDEAEWLTLRELLEESGFDSFDDVPAGPEDDEALRSHRWETALNTVSAAFTLLRLTGSIDPEGKDSAVRALELLVDMEDNDPGLVRELEDLRSWTGQHPA